MDQNKDKPKTSADIYLDKLREMVRQSPDSKLFLTLAEELRKRDETEEALSILIEGVRKNPSFVAARLTLGRWYLKDKKFAEARDEFARVLEISPEDKFALRYIKEAEAGMGETRGASIVKELNAFLAGIKKVFGDSTLNNIESGKS